MQISKETVQILKNFSGINSNLLFKPGNKLSTISPQKNVMAEVTVAETFPVEVGIYDLNKLLGLISEIDDPDVRFTDKSIVICEGADGDNGVQLFASEPSLLTLPPEKKISFPSPDVEFVLTGAVLTHIQRLASLLKATDVSFVGKDGQLWIHVSDLKNTSSDNYKKRIGETDLSFRANIKIDNLKMIPQDYTVSISSKKISRWVDMAGNMTVFVALEANSQF